MLDQILPSQAPPLFTAEAFAPPASGSGSVPSSTLASAPFPLSTSQHVLNSAELACNALLSVVRLGRCNVDATVGNSASVLRH
jgi:hypothetical protein